MATYAASAFPAPASMFGWLAAGIVMEEVDLRVNGFDLLPDALGFLIVVLAAARLRPAHGAFTAAIVAGLAAAPVSVAALAPNAHGLSSKTGSPLLDALLALADVVILASVCTGVAGAAAAAGDADLAASARRLRPFVVTAAVIWLLSPVLGPVLARLPIGLAAGLLVGYAVAGLVALILLVRLLRRASRALGGVAPAVA
jgi:hypothetical protein